MTDIDVEKTLEDEARLLDDVAAYIRKFPNEDFTGPARFIQESWARFIEQRAATNRKVTNVGLVEDMEAEHRQLRAYVEATEKKPLYSEKWREFFLCEQQILEHLMERCDKTE
jgi:hypothetical protein